jgi:hypothetical protein
MSRPGVTYAVIDEPERDEVSVFLHVRRDLWEEILVAQRQAMRHGKMRGVLRCLLYALGDDLPTSHVGASPVPWGV